MDKPAYKKELRELQIELVKLQRHIIRNDRRVLIIFEGRDASGKDGAIKRITAHLSPRETRVVALGKPTERENRAWYFQRYVAQLPECPWYRVRADHKKVARLNVIKDILQRLECPDREQDKFPVDTTVVFPVP